MFERLQAADGDTPEGFLALDDAALRHCGFSRQKAGYARAIARAVLDREVDLEAIAGLSDGEARGTLMKLRGIGPWTADNYLLWALGRRDVFPEGDLALVRGWSLLTGEPEDDAALQAVAHTWRPMRSAAAFLLWEYYLAVRGGPPITRLNDPAGRHS
jgi:DNA-3-methyladenine glycosylase II